jgi:hypothetical protein
MSTTMNTSDKGRLGRALLSAACILALAAGGASAQQAGGGAGGSDNSDQDFKQPLRSKRAARAPRAVEGQPQAKSYMTLRQSEGDDEYEVVIEGDQITSAKVNGKEVPEKRIRRSDDRVEILDKDGNVMTTFLVGKGGWSTLQFPGLPGQAFGQAGPRTVTGWSQPKVMLGINMTEVPEEMADQLKLDADEAIFIARVLPGSPAEKAGLRDKDVVVAVNGERPATREKVAEAIKGKEPGDDVAFTVIRAGKERSIKIELARYDPKVMQTELPGGLTITDPEHQREFQEHMQERMKELYKRMPQAQGGQGGNWFFDPSNDNLRFYTPQAPRSGAESAELKARLKELDERMADLDKKMEALSARLEKLNTALDQRRDRDR